VPWANALNHDPSVRLPERNRLRRVFVSSTSNPMRALPDGQNTQRNAGDGVYRADIITPDCAALWQVDLMKNSFQASENKGL
jgi:hypothetical protein